MQGSIGKPYIGSCQNYGPWSLFGVLNNRFRIIIRTQKGTIILTTTHIVYDADVFGPTPHTRQDAPETLNPRPNVLDPSCTRWSLKLLKLYKNLTSPRSLRNKG